MGEGELIIERSRLEGARRRVAASSAAEMVADRAARTPDAPAVRHGELTVDFRGLHDGALRVARYLAARGIGPGDRVALWAERTPSVLYAALGSWLAGAAYVPIDPSYPAERVRTILELGEPALLLHDGEGTGRPPPEESGSIDIAEPLESPPAEPRRLPASDEAAYVIFTSGSTGVPNGVVVEHCSLANYVAWCGSIVSGEGGAPLFGSMGFDHTVTSWWIPLTHGCPVDIVAGTWDQAALFAPRPTRWAFMKVTPSHARLFERLSGADYDAVTECLLFGGEKLRPELLEQLADRLNGVRLVNHYGPTEATVGCCLHEFELADVAGLDSVPIGRPAWNSRAYVVDDDLRAVKPGEPGELVIAGACVARGYLHGGGARFVEESEVEGGEAGGRAYRTGDVVRQLSDGSLTFLGRDDDQLNVGGHRIEREELRRHTLAVPGVAEATFDVVAGDVEIVRATVVVEAHADRDDVARAIRQALGASLPAAVVPKRVDVVDSLAVNAHGKLDLSEAPHA